MWKKKIFTITQTSDDMVKKEKLYMPMGAGGLLRYSEEEKEVIRVKPEHVIYIVIGIIAFEIVLRILFPL